MVRFEAELKNRIAEPSASTTGWPDMPLPEVVFVLTPVMRGISPADADTSDTAIRAKNIHRHPSPFIN